MQSLVYVHPLLDVRHADLQIERLIFPAQKRIHIVEEIAGFELLVSKN